MVVFCAFLLAALSQLAKDVWGTMRPEAGAAFTSSDYATAVKAILESPYNAVERQQLVAVLGKRPLEGLVQDNQLALRPYSSWATDINPDAFGPARRLTVVTAPTSMHLYLMRAEEKTLLAPLNSQQVGRCYGVRSQQDLVSGPPRNASIWRQAALPEHGTSWGASHAVCDIPCCACTLGGCDPHKARRCHTTLRAWVAGCCVLGKSPCILLHATIVSCLMQLPLLHRPKLGTAAAVGLPALPLDSGQLLRAKLQLCPPASKLWRTRSSK